MILEQKWNILAAILLVVGVGALTFYNQGHLKCPDDYATLEEHLAAVEEWTNDFYDKHLDASLGDWAKAREEFWRQNNCKAALQRSADYESGNADSASKKIVDDAVDEAVLSQQMTHLLDEKKYEEAVAVSNDFIKTHPDALDVWTYRAVAFVYLGNCVEAAAAAYHVSVRSPQDDPSHELLSGILKSSVCAR